MFLIIHTGILAIIEEFYNIIGKGNYEKYFERINWFNVVIISHLFKKKHRKKFKLKEKDENKINERMIIMETNI